MKKITAILTVLILYIMSATFAMGANLHIKPSITLSGEYNDNIYLQEHNEIEEYIARVILGLELNYTSLRTDLNILYAPEYRYFVNYDEYADKGDKEEIIHYLDANAAYILINNLIFIESSDKYERVSLNVTRDFTRESLFVNQSDRNTFNVNPYFKLSISPLVTFRAGYAYRNIWYDKEEGIDKYDNIIHADMSAELTERTTLDMKYTYTNETVAEEDQRRSGAVDFERHKVSIGGQYEYQQASSLSLLLGYGSIDFAGGNEYDYIFWNARIVQPLFSLIVSLETDRDVTENPTGDPLLVDRYDLRLSSPTFQSLPGSISTINSSSLERIRNYDRSRTDFSISLYLKTYSLTTSSNVDTITFDSEPGTIRYGSTASINHYFSVNSVGDVKFTAEKDEEKDLETYSMLYLAKMRLLFLLTRDINVSLSYAYTNSYSPDIISDRYDNNRVMASLKKSF